MHHYSHIAFLRGINLGKRRVKMERLRELFETAGFEPVHTFIASGNVLFHTAKSDRHGIATTIQQTLRDGLGYEVDTCIRSSSQLEQIAAMRPFGDDEEQSVQVALLHNAVNRNFATQLEACSTEIDSFVTGRQEIFWRCRTKISESKVWKSPPIKALQLPSSTMRNMTTVRKIASLATEQEA